MNSVANRITKEMLNWKATGVIPRSIDYKFKAPPGKYTSWKGFDCDKDEITPQKMSSLASVCVDAITRDFQDSGNGLAVLDVSFAEKDGKCFVMFRGEATNLKGAL